MGNLDSQTSSILMKYPIFEGIFFVFMSKTDRKFDFLCNVSSALQHKIHGTGKSLSEALLFAEHGEDMLCTKIVLNVRNNFCTQHVLIVG